MKTQFQTKLDLLHQHLKFVPNYVGWWYSKLDDIETQDYDYFYYEFWSNEDDDLRYRIYIPFNMILDRKDEDTDKNLYLFMLDRNSNINAHNSCGHGVTSNCVFCKNDIKYINDYLLHLSGSYLFLTK